MFDAVAGQVQEVELVYHRYADWCERNSTVGRAHT